MNIEQKATEVLENVASIAKVSGRLPEDITTIAVTKYVEPSVASQVVDAGIYHLGENRVDSFLKKYETLNDKGVIWHLIGTLQRRKVKEVINKIDYFHALDSVKLASEIQKRAFQPIKCFLQVNISREESKHGFLLEEIDAALTEMEDFDKVEIIGLMTMAPLEASREKVLELFSKMQQLRNTLQKRKLSHMPFTELSMGMTGDYDLAIESGATYLRIGSAFFK